MILAETFITEAGGTQTQAYREGEPLSEEKTKELRESLGLTDKQLTDIRDGLEVL